MSEKIDWYREVLEIEPNSKVFFPLARLLVKENLPDEAVRVLEKGLDRHPEFLEARLLLIELLFKNNQTSACRLQIAKLSQMFSAYAGFWEAWAACLATNPQDADVAAIIRVLAATFIAGPIQLHEILDRGVSSILREKREIDTEADTATPTNYKATIPAAAQEEMATEPTAQPSTSSTEKPSETEPNTDEDFKDANASLNIQESCESANNDDSGELSSASLPGDETVQCGMAETLDKNAPNSPLANTQELASDKEAEQPEKSDFEISTESMPEHPANEEKYAQQEEADNGVPNAALSEAASTVGEPLKNEAAPKSANGETFPESAPSELVQETEETAADLPLEVSQAQEAEARFVEPEAEEEQDIARVKDNAFAGEAIESPETASGVKETTPPLTLSDFGPEESDEDRENNSPVDFREETDDEPFSLRTRSMADVLAEQGDIKGALDIYMELSAGAEGREYEELNKKIAELQAKLAILSEKTLPQPDDQAKENLLGILEALARRVEARVNN